MNIVDSFFNWEQIRAILPDLFIIGLPNTLILAVAAMILGSLVGILVALASISKRAVLRVPARIYVDLLRGLPVILTIFLLGQGLPLMGLRIFGTSSYPYGILTLALIAGAYIAEIFRSGIQALPAGQLEAARALGMSHSLAMRLIVIPQGVRNVLPALTNQFIATIKDSSLVYLLGFSVSERELYRIGQDAAQQTGNLSPLVAAGIMYLIITVPLTYVVNWMDRRFKTGRRPGGAATSGSTATSDAAIGSTTSTGSPLASAPEQLQGADK
ncbi:His/Glu/Gln/Arg/opine family amino acid ABC transporter permease subunit [Kineococcus radiotolerans]|uniref:His/Glu/Gln/Arg/opine family amino acid ABC transporter permease subunit n=1 Tax=Kineococcus radiotolerans TaxID=131568 RepID=A0A7W4XZP8_KINRA|nr:amino acid ABC transporter permease [Kineococcus radiotolerans]MBB2903570.1 His/Glu/Gln/Arg/opine family amino acid ABC transporter permease subunit [Kineococcus radiotolerans]